MGGTSPTGIDQSWGEAKESAVRAAVQSAPGRLFLVSMYLSHDPSKNVTAADVKRYHRAGAGLWANWENDAGAPLKGARQGKADATEAVRQLQALIKAVGYAPRNRLAIPFSCDRDVTAAQIRGPVADYYRATGEVVHAAGFRNACYGHADLVKYLATHGITDAEWQTYAWSGGRLDPAADFYQYLNGQKLGGADVDFDRIIHPAQLGAWWPPGHRYDAAPATLIPADLLEEIMALPGAPKDYQAFLADIREIVNTPSWKSARDGYKTGYSPDTVMRFAVTDDAAGGIGEARKQLASIAAVVNESAVRTAKLQAAVAAMQPAAQVAVDVAAIAAATADAVASKLKTLVWGAK